MSNTANTTEPTAANDLREFAASMLFAVFAGTAEDAINRNK